ncbi:MAG: helix-turn-helix transcriptional regulator [Acidimicrobiales bacterium]
MRADRLVATLLLLQAHGQMTAPEIARRLEVSERTVRRDLDALCMAGVPLYAQRGRGGGWAILGGHRIDLTGLTADEAEALSVATTPGGSTVGAELEAAMRKVLVALPEPLRRRVQAAREAFLVDPAGWGREPVERPAHLDALRAAVVHARQVDLGYAPPGRPAEVRRLHPLGLVCKRDVWYLVAMAPAGLRTYRLSRVTAVADTGLPASRPEGFDLASAWADVERRVRDRFVGIEVDLTVSSRAADGLRAAIAAWSRIAETDQPGRWIVTMPNAAVAARELAGFGDEVQVHAPPEVRGELARVGERLVERYG